MDANIRTESGEFQEVVLLETSSVYKKTASIDLNAVDRTILKEFFGHICKKKDKNGIYFDLIPACEWLQISNQRLLFHAIIGNFG